MGRLHFEKHSEVYWNDWLMMNSDFIVIRLSVWPPPSQLPNSSATTHCDRCLCWGDLQENSLLKLAASSTRTSFLPLECKGSSRLVSVSGTGWLGSLKCDFFAFKARCCVVRIYAGVSLVPTWSLFSRQERPVRRYSY